MKQAKALAHSVPFHERQGYLLSGTGRPRGIVARSGLLSPFMPLLWGRDRKNSVSSTCRQKKEWTGPREPCRS